MSTHQPQVNVHVQTGAGEVLRVASTVLLFGGAGALSVDSGHQRTSVRIWGNASK